MYGFIPDMQRCKPVELAGSSARTGFGHLGNAEIDAVGQYSGEQQDLILRRLSGLQMSEVLAEPGPAINFQEQVSDFDMWEQSVSAAHQHARLFRHRVGQRCYLQSALADRSVGQFAAGSKAFTSSSDCLSCEIRPAT